MVLEYMVSRAFIMNSVDLSGSNFNKMTSAILNKHAVAFIAVKNKLDEFLLLAEKDKSPSSNLAKFKALIQNYSVSLILPEKYAVSSLLISGGRERSLLWPGPWPLDQWGRRPTAFSVLHFM